jgi:hypothetical protein
MLDADVFLTFSRRPAQLGEELGPEDRLVVLDEIQVPIFRSAPSPIFPVCLRTSV